MKPVRLCKALVILALGAGCATTLQPPSAPGQYPQHYERSVTKTVAADYLLALPEGYSHEGAPMPLLVFLHGAGERGDDLELVKTHGPPKQIAAGENLPFIVLSPQCPAGSWWSNDVLINLIDHIMIVYNVDPSRIYLTGLSMGGYGTWSLAIERPDLFAAIVPICGGGIAYRTSRLTDVPAWVFHGAKDEVVPVSESEDMVRRMRDYGGTVKFTVYPDAGHDAWTATYDNPDVYSWLLSHRKGQ